MEVNAPTISYTYSSYLAIAIIAALDSVFGGIASVINKELRSKNIYIRFFRKCNISNTANNIRTKVECGYLSGGHSSVCVENV